MTLLIRRRYAAVLAVAIAGLFILVLAATFGVVKLELVPPVFAADYTNGPISSDDSGDGCGTDHTSTVHYNKDTSPFVAYVDKVNYGGRKPKGDFGSLGHAWRRAPTKYWDWNGTSWVLDTTVSASSWRTTGSCPGLAWWDLGNDVTLDGGALVVQYLDFKYFSIIGQGWVNYSGRDHDHYLE